MDKFLIRDAIQSDKNFIFSSWLKGLYFGSDWFNEIPGKIFFKNYQLVIEKILAKSTTQVSVACLPDAQDVVLGYAVFDKSTDTIHWIFIKDSWRKMGIARSLLPKVPGLCTHLTKTGRYLKHKYAIVFNPFLI